MAHAAACPVCLQQLKPVINLMTDRIAPGNRQRCLAQVGCHPARQRQLRQQGNDDCPRPGSGIKDTALPKRAGKRQHGINQGFGVGARVQHVRRHVKAPPVELALTGDARYRLTPDTPGDELVEQCCVVIGHHPVRLGNKIGLAQPGCVLQQQPRIAPPARNACLNQPVTATPQQRAGRFRRHLLHLLPPAASPGGQPPAHR
jgi:hypothetical protein